MIKRRKSNSGYFKKGMIPWNKGKKGLYKCSEETKEKLSKDRKGKKKSPMSESQKKLLSEIHKGKKNPLTTGKNHWRWRGGITSENKKIKNSIEYHLWRESVFARDSWICQKCKKKGGKLNAHHIKNFAQYVELRFAIDNGITLCEKCHRKFHKKYGIKNNTKEQIKEFLCQI